MANILTNPWVLAALAGGSGYLEGLAKEREGMRAHERDLAIAQLGIQGKKELVEVKDQTEGAKSLRRNRDARTNETNAKTVARNLSNERDLNYQPRNYQEKTKAELGEKLAGIKQQQVEIQRQIANKKKAETAAEKRLQQQNEKQLEREAFINNIPLYVKTLQEGGIDEYKLGKMLDKLDLWDDPTVFNRLLPHTESGKEYRARKMKGVDTNTRPIFEGFNDSTGTTGAQSDLLGVEAATAQTPITTPAPAPKPVVPPPVATGGPFQLGMDVSLSPPSVPRLGQEQAQWPAELSSADIAELTEYAARRGRSIATTQDRARVYSEAVAELQAKGQ